MLFVIDLFGVVSLLCVRLADLIGPGEGGESTYSSSESRPDLRLRDFKERFNIEGVEGSATTSEEELERWIEVEVDGCDGVDSSMWMSPPVWCAADSSRIALPGSRLLVVCPMSASTAGLSCVDNCCVGDECADCDWMGETGWGGGWAVSMDKEEEDGSTAAMTLEDETNTTSLFEEST